MDMFDIPSGNDEQFAIERGYLIVNPPSKKGDFPQLCQFTGGCHVDDVDDCEEDATVHLDTYTHIRTCIIIYTIYTFTVCIYLSIYLSVCLSVYLSVCLSVYLHMCRF